MFERYDAPVHKIPRKNVVQIQIRVSVVLKYWVENQSIDFDQSLIQRLFEFYEKLATDGHDNLSKLLKKDLQRKVTP